MPKMIKFLRLSFLPPTALLIAGGSIVADNPHLGRILTLVGYALFAVLLLLLIGIELYLWTMRARLIASSNKVSKMEKP
jgi:hypothetical protein